MSYPDDNPKTAQGAKKVPLHLVPPSASHYLALAFKDGAAKYGPYNWRDQKVSASVYVGAAKRHIDAWWDGENLSSDALVEHLAHVMACCAIILDAASIGTLNDDRPTAGAAARLQAEAEQRKSKKGGDPGYTYTILMSGEFRAIPKYAPEFYDENGRFLGIHMNPISTPTAYDAHPGTPPATDTGD